MVARRIHPSVSGVVQRHDRAPLLIVADTEQDALMLKVAARVAGFSDQILFTTGFDETVSYFSRVTQYADSSVYPEPGTVLIFASRLADSHFELLSGLETAWKIPTVVLTSEPDLHLLHREPLTRYLPRPSKPDNLVDLLREALGTF